MAINHWDIASGATLYAGCAAPDTSLPSWVESLPLWQWYEIPNTSMSSVNASSAFVQGNSGPASKVNAWCGAALRKLGSWYVRGPSGGHNDYAGNETDAIQLNTETPAWVNLQPGSVDADIINTSQVNLDLRTAATHTYYAAQYVDGLDKLITRPFPGISPGNGWPNPPADWPYNYGDRVTAFDWANNDWDSPDQYPTLPAYSSGDGTACLVVKHPITEEIYYSRNGYRTFCKFNPFTGVWTSIAPSDTYNYYCGAAIDPDRERMLLVGSYGGDVAPRYLGLDGVAQAETFGGLGAAALTFGGYPGVQYDPVNDCYYVIIGATGGLEIHRVAAATSVIDTPAKTGTRPPSRIAGVHNSAQYVPELRGLVGTSTYSGNLWFIRTSL